MATPAIWNTMDSLYSAGLTVELTKENGIKVSPASTITNVLRALIVKHKMAIVAYLIEAANNAAPIPDCDCRDTDAVISTSEIYTTKARATRFNSMGVIERDTKDLVDALLKRDRDLDDRRLCLECQHLGGYGQSSWRCGNWQAAGVAIRARDAQLPVALVLLLQRCTGFQNASLNKFSPVTDMQMALACNLPKGEIE
jgi:hypothetical protein